MREDFDRWLDDEAPLLRKHWDSPELWPRIAGSLEVERGRHVPASSRGLRWTLGLAASLIVLMIPSAWLVWRSQTQTPALLTEQTMQEVQTAERAYAQSIEKLAGQASRQIANPPTALAASYREKLLVLDSAIAELRTEADRNPYNHHVRTELLALYQNKQQTLQELLHETP
jgi:hypothetical protein